MEDYLVTKNTYFHTAILLSALWRSVIPDRSGLTVTSCGYAVRIYALANQILANPDCTNFGQRLVSRINSGAICVTGDFHNVFRMRDQGCRGTIQLDLVAVYDRI
jgi:hypothetical protein